MGLTIPPTQKVMALKINKARYRKTPVTQHRRTATPIVKQAHPTDVSISRRKQGRGSRKKIEALGVRWTMQLDRNQQLPTNST